MKYQIIAILIFLTSLNLFANDNEIINRGIEFLKKGEYEKSKIEFAKVIEKSPDNFYAVFNRGLAYLYTEDYSAAVADFSDAIRIDDKHADAYNNRGLSFSFLGELEFAMLDFNYSLSLDPDSPETLINRGSAYISLGMLDSAEVDLSKAIKLEKDNPELYTQRGRLYQETNRYKEAISDYTKAIEMGIKGSKMYFNRGNCYFKLGEFHNAIKDLTIVINEDPDDLEARNNRAIAYKELNMLEEAEADTQYLEQKTEYLYPPLEKLNFERMTFFDGLSSIEVPDNWVINESSNEGDYYAVITPEPIESDDQPVFVAASVYLLRDLDLKYGMTSEEQILKNWESQTADNTKDMSLYQLELRTTKFHNGKPAILRNSMMQAGQGYIIFTMYEYAVAYNGNLYYVFFQCPAPLWDYYKLIFEVSLASLFIEMEEN